jgi:hypothetical protein
MGCYEDNVNRDFKVGPIESGRGDVDLCQAACSDYAYFALQDGGKCRCDNEAPDLPKIADSRCNIYEDGLGGSWANAVYRNGAAPGWELLGCFQDDVNRDFDYGPKRGGYDPDSCQAACADYEYFALQDNGWCQCDNSFSTPASSYPEIADSRCGSEGLGGSWANNVYRTTASADAVEWTVTENTRCSQELWQCGTVHAFESRETCEARCDDDDRCLGLMWYNKLGGSFETSTSGWYQGCAGTPASSSNSVWDTAVKA